MRKLRDAEQLKEDLRNHVDLVAFVQRHIPELRLRGKRWVASCPFHENSGNNPTFTVNPETVYDKTGSRGVYGCWACDARGDLFGFTMRWWACSFYEAIENIAEQTDFDLTPYYRDMSPDEQLREDRHGVVEKMAELFCQELLSNEFGREFFDNKGINEESLWKFKLGYCPSMDFLNEHVNGDVLQWVEPDVFQRQRLFGGRLLYPQFTTQGRIWGWYARQPDGERPKYVGPSKDCALFDGTQRLYGFHFARKILNRSPHPLIVVEGFHDTIVAQQHGFPATAQCGTKLSDQQIETLRGFSIHKAISCLDEDDAGQEGMFEIATRAPKIEGLQFRFAPLEKEAEDYINAYGAESFSREIDNAVGAVDFILGRFGDVSTASSSKKQDFLDKIRPYLAAYPQRSLDRAFGISAASKKSGLADEVIADYLTEKSNEPLVNIQAEQIVLAELATSSSSWVMMPDITEDDFSLDRHRQTYRYMREVYENGGEVSLALLHMHAANALAPDEVMDTISKLSLTKRENPEPFASALRDKAVRRNAQRIVTVTNNQLRDPRSPVNETLANLIEGVTNTSSSSRRSVFTSAEAVDSTIRELEEMVARGGKIAGIDLGSDFEWYNRMINGLREGRVNMIAATSGVGKSNLLLNIIHRISVVENYGFESPNLELFNEPPQAILAPRASALVVSGEMSKEESVKKLAAMDSGVPHYFITHGTFETEEQQDLFYDSMARIREARITWMPGQRTVQEIIMRARMLQANGEVDYVAIDYVQLLKLPMDRRSKQEKLAEASQQIVDAAEQLRLPFLVVVQLNREAMKEDMPTGEHIAGAWDIFQDAHSFLTLVKRDSGIQAALGKNRDGGEGQFKMSFDHNPQTSSLLMKETSVMGNR